MSSSTRILARVPSLLLLTVASFVLSTNLVAEGKRKNPTSKLYVADIEGLSSINTGEKIEDLTKKSVYAAEGVVLETKPDANNALVLSNGTGIAFDPDTRLEMRRFLQEPFSPNRSDLEIEPSVSQTTAFLPKGTVGLCTSKMVAGSTMTYNTRHASIAIRGRKVVIETTDNETTVSLLEGDVTVRGDLTAGGQSIKPGQQAIISRKSNFEPPVITIRDIPKDDMNRLGEKVTIACMARKTVYFEVADRKRSSDDGIFSQTDASGEEVLVPIQVLPGKISPEHTASPYTIAPTSN